MDFDLKEVQWPGNEDTINDMSQGYLTLATGDRQFFDAAVNLAISVQLNDAKRPISLLCDDVSKLKVGEKAVFDRIIVALPGTLGVGCAGKLDLPGFLPYQETMFLDSDCLVMKPDMDRHWKKLATQCFNVTGGILKKGSWYTFDAADVCEALFLPYMVRMNSGVMYFRKGAELDGFMETVVEFRENARDVLFVQHRDMTAQFADEPFWSAAMGHLKMLPAAYSSEDGTMMETTYMACDFRFDPIDHLSELQKSKGYWLLGRFFSKGWVKHSPTIAHFIRFKPRALYRECADQLRVWANIEKSDI